MLFPDSWQVTRLLVANFSECTRSDLANVLAKQTPAVSVLLDALQGTLDFESGMSRKFGMPVSYKADAGNSLRRFSLRRSLAYR